MATTTHVPVEVYLRSSYEPDAEYVDGAIEERAVGEYDHAAWQEAICFWFRQHAKDWNVRVKPELRIQVSPTRFRVPDATVLDRAQPIEQIVTLLKPVLCDREGHWTADYVRLRFLARRP